MSSIGAARGAADPEPDYPGGHPGGLKIQSNLIKIQVRFLVSFWAHFGVVSAPFWDTFRLDFRIDF